MEQDKPSVGVDNERMVYHAIDVVQYDKVRI